MEDKRWISRLGTVTYMLGETVIDNIARKVAEEPMEDELENWIVGETEDGHMPLVRKPQHVIDEEKVDEAIMRRHDLRQMEMYDDPYMNWSGLR